MSYYETYDVYQPGDRVFIGSPGGWDGEVVEVDSEREMYAVKRDDDVIEWCHTSWLVWYDNDKRRGAADYHNGSHSFAYRTEPPCKFGERTIIRPGEAKPDTHLGTGKKRIPQHEETFILSVSKRFTSHFMSLPVDTADVTIGSSPGVVGGRQGWARLDMTEEQAKIFVANCQKHCDLYRVELFSEKGEQLAVGDAAGMRAAKGFSTSSAGMPPKGRELPIIRVEDLDESWLRTEA